MGFEVGDEVDSSGHACADEEEHKTELTENVQSVFGHTHVNGPDVAEMADYEADDKGAARRAEGEIDSGNFDCSENDSQRNGGHKGEEIQRVKLFKLLFGSGWQRRWLP